MSSCDKCGKSLIHQLIEGRRCPFCGEKLAPLPAKEERYAIACPYCEMPMLLDSYTEGDPKETWQCEKCHKFFRVGRTEWIYDMDDEKREFPPPTGLPIIVERF